MQHLNSADAVSTEDDFRSLERTRLRALVERNIALARLLHSPDFHLVTPRGTTRSRDSYLGAIESGELVYVKWEAAGILVRVLGSVALLRYRAELEIRGPSGDSSSFGCWHTDSYELHDGLWQVVWSQATRLAD